MKEFNKQVNKELLKVLDWILGTIVLTAIVVGFMIFNGKVWGKHGTQANYTV